MSYPRLLERVYAQPVCITAARFHAIHSFLLPRLSGKTPVEIHLQAADPSRNPAPPTVSPLNAKRRQKAAPSMGYDARGNLVVTDPRMYTEAAPGLAVVPIYGVLAKNLSAWEESCGGGTDINAPQEALAQAVDAEDITAIILDIDSPGGEVTGIPEFAQLIRAAGSVKPVYAFTDASMCSAAYWLASQATEIYCTASAQIGSIGTYLAWLDETVKMQLEGVQLQFFSEGKHKGIGLPGRPLTMDDRTLLQSRVTAINDQFQAAVTGMRGQLPDGTMEGQSFSGAEAVQRGLADALMLSWDELVSMLTTM